MKTHILTFLLFLGFSSSLSACNPAVSEITVTPMVAPLSSLEVMIPLSPTARIMPTAVSIPATKTPTNTPTSRPTATSTITPAPYLSPTIPPATLSALYTMDALVTQNPLLGEYYNWGCILYPCYTYGLGLSPDGKWAAFFAVNPHPDIQNDGGLFIVKTDGSKQWEIFNSDFTGYKDSGVRTVSVKHWSVDGRYVYLVPTFESSGGYNWLWGNVYQLIRFELETGFWIDTGMNLAFSFSPDGRYIAYRRDNSIIIHELQTAHEQIFRLPSEFVDFGHIVWSPDSSRFILVAASENLLDEQKRGFSAYLVDVQIGALRNIFENDTRYIYPLLWVDTDHIIFDSLFDGPKYVLDLRTNEITLFKKL